MRCAEILLTVPLLLAGLAVDAPRASAEWFADLYVGGAFTESEDITLRTPVQSGKVKTRFRDADFDSSVTLGGRFGRWFDSFPVLGLALDVSSYDANIESQRMAALLPGGSVSVRLRERDISVTAISFDLMARLRLLTSTGFPHGRLQPYVSIGPALFIADPDRAATDVTLGLLAGAGGAWQFTRELAAFGEFRVTHFRPEFEGHNERLTTDIDTAHALAGVSIRF